MMYRCLAILSLAYTSLQGAALPELMQRAVDGNSDLAAVRQGIASACAEIYEQRAAFQPELSAEAGWVNEQLDSGIDNYGYSYLEGRWNLYRGGYDCAQRKILQSRHQIAYLEYEKQRKTLLREVWREYTELLHYQELHRLLEEGLSGNAEHKGLAQKKRGAGLATEADVMEFDLYQGELEAEIRCNRKALSQHRHSLALLLGEPEEACELAVEGDFIHLVERDCCQLYAMAIGGREDKLQLEEEICISKQRYKQGWSAYRPKLDLRASWGKEPADEEDRGFGSIVQLGVSVPLFDGRSSYYKRKVACAQQRELRYRHEQLERSVHAKLSEMLCRIDILQEKLAAAQARLERVESFWNLTRKEYQRGIRDSGGLMDAADRRLRSQVEILTLKRDMALALIDLVEVAGGEPSTFTTTATSTSSSDASVSS